MDGKEKESETIKTNFKVSPPILWFLKKKINPYRDV